MIDLMSKSDIKYINELMLDVQKEHNVQIDQVFSGWITDNQKDQYSVNLDDCTNNQDICGEIAAENFPESNLDIGTIFYWYLGKDNQNNKFSKITLFSSVWSD